MDLQGCKAAEQHYPRYYEGLLKLDNAIYGYVFVFYPETPFVSLPLFRLYK
jgi:hypothetical protein